ncbi:MAG: SMC-Scp complex subunit ScpB [bacterium]
MELNELANVLEGLLFLSPRPVKADDVTEHLGADAEHVGDAFRLLAERREGTGLELKEVAGGFELVTRAEGVEHLKKFFSNLEKTRLSRAALETVAVVAYRQPITRGEIEAIRGVNSSGVLQSLLEKELIRISGRSDAPGRPFRFSTTPAFLRLLGLKNLTELPAVETFDKKV